MFETNIAEFAFLKKRFEPKFFNKFLCQYLLFLFELSDRLNLDHTEMSKEFLALLYTDKIEVLSPYSFSMLELLIYGEHNEIGSKEMCFMDSGQKFFLAFTHGFLSNKSFSAEKIQLELFRLIGLLIVNNRPNVRRERNPVLFDLKNGILNYSLQNKLQDSMEIYTHDFKSSATNLNRVKGFGRSYNSATTEFEIFLEKFSLNHQKFLSPELKVILDLSYRDYRKKSYFPITNFISYLQSNYPSLEVYNKNLKLNLKSLQ
jgi:hypothetical protein